MCSQSSVTCGDSSFQKELLTKQFTSLPIRDNLLFKGGGFCEAKDGGLQNNKHHCTYWFRYSGVLFIDFQLSDDSWFFKYSFSILLIYCENERSSFSARSLIFSTMSLSSVMLTFSFNGFKKSPLAVVYGYIIPLNLS